MSFYMSTTAVWGIAAVAAALFVVMGVATIILCRRVRPKIQFARILVTGERRLSGYSGDHFNLTDADVALARMPSTRSVLRRSTHSSRGNSRGYARVNYQESLPRQPTMNMSRAIVRDRTVPQRTTSISSWPLLGRLIRSSAAPITELRALSRAPISKKSAKILEKDRVVAFEVQPVGVDGRDRDKNKTQLPVLDTQLSFQSDIFTDAALKPKPLFHDKLRSSSAGSEAKGSKVQVGEVTVWNREKALPIPLVPRSSSMCNQQPGLAPDKSIPPLPFNLPASKRIQSIKSPAELSPRRTSGNSLLSGDTYILEDRAFMPSSQPQTDPTSISLASPSVSDSKLEGLGIFTGEDEDWKMPKFGW